MARYIDADDFLDLFYVASAGQDKMFVNVVKQVITDTPTADVIPKEFLTRKEDEAYERGYAEGKTDAAREIFEEIEFDIANLDFDRDETRAIAIEGVIANLKKKYIGDRDDKG